MTTKAMNFYTTVWLLSVVICLVIDGSWLNAHNENSIINSLTTMNVLNIGDLVGIGSFLVNFFQGIVRILLWDYTNIYYGGFIVLRYVWLVIFTPAAVWGIGTMFITIFANFLRFRV
jgi:hypothetical protein